MLQLSPMNPNKERKKETGFGIRQTWILVFALPVTSQMIFCHNLHLAGFTTVILYIIQFSLTGSASSLYFILVIHKYEEWDTVYQEGH